MSDYRIDFSAMAWEEGRPGVRMKTVCRGTRRVRLVEFSTGDGFDHPCEEGHIGHVLQGGMTLDVNGEIVEFGAGDVLFIPPGKEAAHRALAIVPGTRLLMVEDI